jgi:hypothetical protein
MTSGRLKYEGGEIGDRDALRLAEPKMSDEEYQAYRAAWWNEFPCHCESACPCQGPPGRRPTRVRIFVELPEEPPQLTPAAARTLLDILQKAGEKRNREAEADGSNSAR